MCNTVSCLVGSTPPIDDNTSLYGEYTYSPPLLSPWSGPHSTDTVYDDISQLIKIISTTRALSLSSSHCLRHPFVFFAHLRLIKSAVDDTIFRRNDIKIEEKSPV